MTESPVPTVAVRPGRVSRWVRWRSVIIAAAVCVAVAGYALTRRNYLLAVEIRDLMFWHHVSQTQFDSAYASAATFPGHGIRMDADAQVALFSASLAFPASDILVGRGASAATTMERLVRELPGSGGEGCGAIDPLAERLAVMRHGGYGCCSDFVNSFLALSRLNGLTARELVNRDHNFAEVFDPEARRWIFVDPQYGLAAAREDGTLLGVLELRDRLESSTPVTWIVLKPDVPQPVLELAKSSYYTRASFRALRVTMGADVMTQDAALQRLRYLPKMAREFIAYMEDGLPVYMGYSR